MDPSRDQPEAGPLCATSVHARQRWSEPPRNETTPREGSILWPAAPETRRRRLEPPRRVHGPSGTGRVLVAGVLAEHLDLKIERVGGDVEDESDQVPGRVVDPLEGGGLASTPIQAVDGDGPLIANRSDAYPVEPPRCRLAVAILRDESPLDASVKPRLHPGRLSGTCGPFPGPVHTLAVSHCGGPSYPAVGARSVPSTTGRPWFPAVPGGTARPVPAALPIEEPCCDDLRSL